MALLLATLYLTALFPRSLLDKSVSSDSDCKPVTACQAYPDSGINLDITLAKPGDHIGRFYAVLHFHQKSDVNALGFQIKL